MADLWVTGAENRWNRCWAPNFDRADPGVRHLELVDGPDRPTVIGGHDRGMEGGQ